MSCPTPVQPAVVGTKPITGCPFIPCANFSTAVYYQEQLRKGAPIDSDILEAGTPAVQDAPWFVSLLN
jgi:hypothetical protein